MEECKSFRKDLSEKHILHDPGVTSAVWLSGSMSAVIKGLCRSYVALLMICTLICKLTSINLL